MKRKGGGNLFREKISVPVFRSRESVRELETGERGIRNTRVVAPEAVLGVVPPSRMCCVPGS